MFDLVQGNKWVMGQDLKMWGWKGGIFSKTSSARGFRSMTKGRRRSYGRRRTRRKGVSFGRREENNNVDFKSRCGDF